MPRTLRAPVSNSATARSWRALGVTAAALSTVFASGCANEYRGAYASPRYAGASFDSQSGACETMAANEAVLCEVVLPRATAAAAFEMRRQYDTHASGCPAYAHQGAMARLEACVQRMEATAAAADPGGADRRAAAAPRVPATRDAPAFKALIESWFQALDRKNIACRDRDLSESNARECARAHGAMQTVEASLTDYLVGEGYDRRDFTILGLWPRDRAARVSPN